MTWEQQQQVEREAPPQLLLPTGTRAAISYSGAQPTACARMQEVFGLADTPRLGGAAGVPLLLELLSPASRPLQVRVHDWAACLSAYLGPICVRAVIGAAMRSARSTARLLLCARPCLKGDYV
jgi:hypothetical protein